MQEQASPSINASQPMISIAEAERVIAGFPVSPVAELLPLAVAANRFLFQDVLSPMAIPEFDKSAMDGFALAGGDTSPRFRIVETIAAGTPPRCAISPGLCAKIMTGAMLPSGAGRVIKRECTSEENGYMRIVAEDRNMNIRRRGEDLQAGELALSRGVRLRPLQVALLASLGIAEVPVARPPRVGIITTGSELVEPGSRLRPGQIYESNSRSLSAQIQEAGAVPVRLGSVADNEAATIDAIAAAVGECDLLILSGGVSAGDFDYVPGALKQAGFRLRFEKIAIQPGMPTVFAVQDGQDQKETASTCRCAFGLPGNPVSTFVIFEIFIKPLLLRWLGHEFRPPVQKAVLAAAFRRAKGERTAFIPVILGAGKAEPVSYHGSAHLHAMAQANALLRVPAGQKEIAAGSPVDVRLI